MKKIINNIHIFIQKWIKDMKELFTSEFILEIIKKPSFIGWAIITIMALVLSLIYMSFTRTIEIGMLGFVFYFVFLRKNI